MKLINDQDVTFANKKLSELYESKIIPAEKKTYLSDLRSSYGPYLASKNDHSHHYFMDAASQIATLGLGFNPTAFFGLNHLQSVWTNDVNSLEANRIKNSITSFLKRKLNWPNLHVSFCNSGAEANEVALGMAYDNRVNKDAKKVLCFEGSFHGRMMVALMSTWNKTKRAPFEWEGFDSVYCPYPENKLGQEVLPISNDWISTWENSAHLDFEAPKSTDDLLNLEIDCLLEVRNALLTGSIFAVLIEPMQCEGGDRYATNRFYQALASMAHAFNVPIIFDEVQTGFNLGRDFFWHQTFNLKNSDDSALLADYVVCAKKAQTGMVLSPKRSRPNDNIALSSIARGYFHGLTIDQNQEKILKLEDKISRASLDFVNRYSEHLQDPRSYGMAFAFDLKDQSKVAKFIKHRFKYGLLYYPAGSNTLRFRVNLSFTDEDIDFLFEGLTKVAELVFNGKEEDVQSPVSMNYNKLSDLYFWQEQFLKMRFNELDDLSEITEWFKGNFDLEFVELTDKNFSNFKDSIQSLQNEVYEPARRTEIEKFEEIANDKSSLAFALVKGEELIAISFAGKASLFPFERGLRREADFNDENVLYMLDTTLAPKHSGKSLGLYIKYALFLQAGINGVKNIKGRNRDRLAARMLEVNTSLGAIETQYITEDYPDNEEYRDVIFYESKVEWKEDRLNLSNAINTPLTLKDLSFKSCTEQMPYLMNKVCLSNFVSSRFLDDIKSLSESLPQELRHMYTASGQSECVDKIARSIFFNQKEKTHKSLTFKGHYFGSGSFLSRSLSGETDFFPVQTLSCLIESPEIALNELESELKNNSFLGIWLEPLLQKTGQKVDRETLEAIIALGEKFNTPVIFNETASSLYRYSDEDFCISNSLTKRPSALMCYTGGQSAFIALNDKIFIENPLMVISTWDGDEFSFHNFILAKSEIERDLETYQRVCTDFNEKIVDTLAPIQGLDFSIQGITGEVTGNIPFKYKSLFKNSLLMPNYSNMIQFINGEL